jgi:CheY-like chemotaxis protein
MVLKPGEELYVSVHCAAGNPTMNGKYSDPRPVVLLVEDEPLLRFFASDVLEEEGFEVIETGTADEALTWLDVRDDVRVIVTDIQMPGP